MHKIRRFYLQPFQRNLRGGGQNVKDIAVQVWKMAITVAHGHAKLPTDLKLIADTLTTHH